MTPVCGFVNECLPPNRSTECPFFRTLLLSKTFVDLINTKTLTIFNNSDFCVDFHFMAKKDKKQDLQFKLDFLEKLQMEEEEEKIFEFEKVVGDGFELTEEKEKEISERISRKFKNVAKAALLERIEYENEIFKISPPSGKIYPKGKISLLVIFRPKLALDYNLTVFCEISGLLERRPVNLMGKKFGEPFERVGDRPQGVLF